MQETPAIRGALPRPGSSRGLDWAVRAMTITVALLVVAGVLVYVLGGSTASSPRARLESALAATRSASTADFALDAKVGFEGISFAITGTGAVDFSTGCASLQTSILGHTIALVETDRVLYVKLGKIVSTRFPGKTWVRMAISATSGAGGSRPDVALDLHDLQQLLSALVKLGATITPIGTESVDGTPDQGYVLHFTIAELEDHPSELPPAARSLFTTSKTLSKSTGITVRMYVDPAGRLQAVHAAVTTQKSPRTTESVDVTMSHFGAASVPAAPPAPQTVTYRQLGSGLGSKALPL